MNANDLMQILAGLGLIGLGVAGLYAFGRDRTANEHDLSDYHEQPPAPLPPKSSRRATLRVIRSGRRPIPPLPMPIEWDEADDILPPAPHGMNAGSPLYAGMLFDTWYPESPAEVAARVLREAGEQARAGLAVAR